MLSKTLPLFALTLAFSFQAQATSYDRDWQVALKKEIQQKCNFAHGSTVAHKRRQDGSVDYKVACGVQYSVGGVNATNFKFINCRGEGSMFVCTQGQYF